MSDEFEAMAFAGEALSPFYLQESGAAFDAFAGLDVDAAAQEWPFVEADVARPALAKMTCGASDEQLWEFRRLFVGPAKKAAPPWGSVYTDRDKVIFGRSALALHEWMGAHGVKRTAEPGMPEDHIGYQLACMAWLARNKPALVDEYLQLHLLTWAPHFLDELREATTHPFYRGLAELTRATLAGIADARGLEVAEPRFYR